MSSSSSTPLNLRGEGDHPEIGIRVDNKGIAYDAETGKSLSRSEVDARVATFQTANPGTEVYGLEKKRGGVAGTWDRNKKVIVPVAAGLLGAATGGVLAPALLGAAARGFDREGKSGVGVDLGQAARGAVEGGVSGYAGSKIASAFGKSGLLGGAAKTAGSTLLGGAGGAGDWLKPALGAIPLVLDYNRQKQMEKTANTQLDNASSGNAAMAELAKALIARGAAPAAAPDLSYLIDEKNPYAKKVRPMIAPPPVDPTTGPAGAPPGASVAGVPSGMGAQSSGLLGALPPGASAGGIVQGAPPPGMTLASILAGIKSPVQPPAAPTPQSGLLGAQSSGMVRGAMPQGQTMASLMEMARKNAPQPPALATPTEVRGAMPAGQTMSSLLELARNNAPKPPTTQPTPTVGSIAGFKSDVPISRYSLGGAKPWTVADAKLSGAVPGAVPTSGPNIDPKTHTEIKSWDTEALQKKRPKPPLTVQELQF